MFSGIPSVHCRLTVGDGVHSRVAILYEPHGAQIPVKGGQLLGLVCQVDLEEPLNNVRSVLGYLDSGNIPTEFDQTIVRRWMMRATVAATYRVLRGLERPNDLGLISLPFPSQLERDPQFESPTAARRQCRADVLAVIAARINSDDRDERESIDLKDVLSSPLLTHLYDEADVVAALHHWHGQGYLVDAAFGHSFRIDISRDADIENAALRFRATPTQPVPMPASSPEFDCFVCHASEDKTAVVKPLVAALQSAGLRVWVDYGELTLGDRLRRKLEDGLKSSRFGVVIVSPSFFAKEWPRRELDALDALETADGRKRILPVWCGVDKKLVVEQAPLSLGDRLAIDWKDGIFRVVEEIRRAME